MELTRIQLMKRHHEFPQLLIDLSYNNTVVHRMIEAYVHGQIATKEEAYCQIIIELSKTRDELTRRMINEAHMKMSLFPVMPPPVPEGVTRLP